MKPQNPIFKTIDFEIGIDPQEVAKNLQEKSCVPFP